MNNYQVEKKVVLKIQTNKMNSNILEEMVIELSKRKSNTKRNIGILNTERNYL